MNEKQIEKLKDYISQVDACMCVTQVEPEDNAAWLMIKPLIEQSISAQDEVLTDEQIDAHINTVLRPTGTKMANFTMQKSKDDLRASMRSVLAAAPSPSLAVRDGVVDDLAMLVRRLVRALEKSNPGTDLAPQALDYLKRKGLQGSPLRADKPNADCSGEPANCPDNEGYGCACDPMNKAAKEQP